MCELVCVCGCKTHDVWAEGEATCTFLFPLDSAGGDLALFIFCFLCKWPNPGIPLQSPPFCFNSYDSVATLQLQSAVLNMDNLIALMPICEFKYTFMLKWSVPSKVTLFPTCESLVQTEVLLSLSFWPPTSPTCSVSAFVISLSHPGKPYTAHCPPEDRDNTLIRQDAVPYSFLNKLGCTFIQPF